MAAKSRARFSSPPIGSSEANSFRHRWGRMMTEPRVCVVTPFFNARMYLKEAIESVLDQDFEDYQLLLVDDGSTDGSTQIALDYSRRESQRVRYLDHKGHQNFGATVSRNLALRQSCSEMVAFLDADDRWRPTKLREQVELLDRFPSVDAVCGTVNFWGQHSDGTDRVIPTGHSWNRPIQPPEALLQVYPLGKADPPCPSDLLMRRSIVELVGGFEETFVGSLQLYEDQAFLAKVFLEGSFLFSDRVWLDYRLHDQSCTAIAERMGVASSIRGQFLEWFEGYLKGTRHWRDPRIRWSLWKALRPYRHPVISRAGRMVKSLFPTSDSRAPDNAALR